MTVRLHLRVVGPVDHVLEFLKTYARTRSYASESMSASRLAPLVAMRSSAIYALDIDIGRSDVLRAAKHLGIPVEGECLAIRLPRWVLSRACEPPTLRDFAERDRDPWRWQARRRSAYERALLAGGRRR